MKYLGIIILFLIANFFFAWFNTGALHWLQPFLIASIFLYFIESNPWIYYSFAVAGGLLVDAFGSGFGLHALSLLLVLLFLNNLQTYIFTSKNTSTIIILSMIGVVAFWFFAWFLNLIFSWSIYHFYTHDWLQILKYYLIDVLAIVFMYIFYFNFKLKKYDSAEKF